VIVYNVSQKINKSILKEWLTWQKEVHIPEIMSTGLFSDYKFYKLLDQDEEEGTTYVIQFFSDSREKYDQYAILFAQGLIEKSVKKWGDRVVAFQTVMHVV
jgi:hypothetical protein